MSQLPPYLREYATADLELVRRLVDAGEGFELEFKATTGQLKRAFETVCALLNGSGGWVVFGVTDGGRIRGQSVSDATLKDVASFVRRIEPSVVVDVSRVRIPETKLEVLGLHVRAEPDRGPFVFDGRPYHRVTSTTSVMPKELYDQLILERQGFEARWEREVWVEGSESSIDVDAMLGLVRHGVEMGRLPEAAGRESATELLERLELMEGRALRQAAAVLFGRRGDQVPVQCALRLVRFRGDTKGVFLDERQSRGNILVLLDEAMLFLERHLPIGGAAPTQGLEREDAPVVPVAARREVLVNALCHRDYRALGGAVTVAVYDTRVEVWSSGLLPRGVEVEDLKGPHRSVPRNPIIAEVLYRGGYVERWGYGTQQVAQLCRDAGLAEPLFVEQAGDVGVVISTTVAADAAEGSLHEEILRLLQLAGASGLSVTEIAMSVERPRRSLQRALSQLVDDGRITARGQARARRYVFGR